MPVIPKVSVILPVYNSEQTIGSAIKSVLDQSFEDFALVVINDGSTDKTAEIIDSFRDPRIRHLKLPKNYGVIAAANLGLAEVEAPLIMRLDADSLALPGRFASQVLFMDNHPEIGVCGSAIVKTNNNGEEHIQYPQEHDHIVASMIFNDPVPDCSAIFRTSLMREKGFRYRDLYPYMAEYDLWYRMRNITLFANLPDVLTRVKTRNHSAGAIKEKNEIMSSFYIEKLNDMGIQPSLKELQLHLDIVDIEHTGRFSKAEKYRQWLDKLKTTNQIVYSFPRLAFNLELDKHWKKLFGYFDIKDFDNAIRWLRIEGKSEPYILKYKMKHKLKWS
jgi:glycosyltransferase involved in cell wall biosynthesis